jgi:hypothetical protein
MPCSLENEGMRREWWVRDCGGDCESGSKWVNRASSGNMLPPIKRDENMTISIRDAGETCIPYTWVVP